MKDLETPSHNLKKAKNARKPSGNRATRPTATLRKSLCMRGLPRHPRLEPLMLMMRARGPGLAPDAWCGVPD